MQSQVKRWRHLSPILSFTDGAAEAPGDGACLAVHMELGAEGETVPGVSWLSTQGPFHDTNLLSHGHISPHRPSFQAFFRIPSLVYSVNPPTNNTAGSIYSVSGTV